MKYIILTGLLLVLLLAATICCGWYITDTAARLTARFPALEAAVREADWDSAQQSFDELERLWRQYSGKWRALLDHAEVHAIDAAVIDLRTLLMQQDRPQAEQALAQLSFLIAHIPESQRVNMENIL